jgi:hypothetical protein
MEHALNAMQEKPKDNCLKCGHFYITWDTHFPRGCKLFGFKSKHLPSQTVYEATGNFCEHFVEKAKEDSRKDSVQNS